MSTREIPRIRHPYTTLSIMVNIVELFKYIGREGMLMMLMK